MPGDEQAKLFGEGSTSVKGDYENRTQHGYMLDECVSSLTKEIRRANEDKALFWALEIVQSGYGQYFWRRMSIIVAEEVGLADFRALLIVNTCQQMFERSVKSWQKGPFATELVAYAILYLCRAPKNSEVAYAAYAVGVEIENGRRDPVPDYGRDMHTKAGRELMRQKGMTKAEEEVWWWGDLARRDNLKPGNRWIRRWVGLDKDLPEDVREQFIAKQLQEYGETEANQL